MADFVNEFDRCLVNNSDFVSCKIGHSSGVESSRMHLLRCCCCKLLCRISSHYCDLSCCKCRMTSVFDTFLADNLDVGSSCYLAGCSGCMNLCHTDPFG